MKYTEKFALETAKEITIAALGNGHAFQHDSGVCTAEYFETVYSKILELAKQVQDD